MNLHRAKAPKRLRTLVATLCLLLLFALSGQALAVAPDPEFPSPLGLVNDFANVLTDSEEDEIWQVAASLWQNQGIELAVVTVDDIAPLDINTYAYKLFKAWGIGDAEKNNGVLVLLCTNPRKIKIEVGLGLEGDLNDAKAGRILDQGLPDLQKNNYGAGLLSISQELASALANVPGEGKSLWQQLPQISGPALFGGSYLLLILLAVIFRQNWLLYLLIRLPMMLIRGGRGGGGGGGFGGYGGGRSGGGGAGRNF